jgi:cytosine/adenosine deaminase-related metal-dependent hydrolase
VRTSLCSETFPHNFVEELRTAAIPTISGTRALDREDLGRIAPGAKADFVMVDITHPAMQPRSGAQHSLCLFAGDR